MEYLNYYVRPHSLISVSLFQQSHGAWKFEEDPEQAKYYLIPLHAVIVHSSHSDGRTGLFNSENESLKLSKDYPIYSFETIIVNDWDKNLTDVISMLNDDSMHYKITVATSYEQE